MVPLTEAAGPAVAVSAAAGLVCPRCGGVRWRTANTRARPGAVMRWKRCLACGHRIVTREAVHFGGST